MAGIPGVMQSMLTPFLPKLEGARPVRSRSVGALGESMVADRLSEIQDANADVDIGSYPFSENGRYGTTSSSAVPTKRASTRCWKNCAR